MGARPEERSFRLSTRSAVVMSGGPIGDLPVS
jgi:hypothetical protein